MPNRLAVYEIGPEGQPLPTGTTLPPQPPDEEPDPTDPPPDPEDPPPTLPPTTVTHGREIRTAVGGPAAVTGYRGLGLTLTQLTPSGTITTSSNGQLIYAKHVSGIIRVNHDNVTIRGCKVHAPQYSHVIQPANGVGGLRVEWCELHQDETVGGFNNGVSGIYHVPQGKNRNIVYRCNIHHVADGAKLSGGWTFEQNYWHPEIKFSTTHNDGIQCQKGVPYFDPSVIVRGNYFLCGHNFGNAATFFTCESGSQWNVTVEANYYACSGNTYCLALGSDDIGTMNGTITIKNNDVLVGYGDATRPGPEGFISHRLTWSGAMSKSGNRLVDAAGNFLGVAN